MTITNMSKRETSSERTASLKRVFHMTERKNPFFFQMIITFGIVKLVYILKNIRQSKRVECVCEKPKCQTLASRLEHFCLHQIKCPQDKIT